MMCDKYIQNQLLSSHDHRYRFRMVSAINEFVEDFEHTVTIWALYLIDKHCILLYIYINFYV